MKVNATILAALDIPDDDVDAAIEAFQRNWPESETVNLWDVFNSCLATCAVQPRELVCLDKLGDESGSHDITPRRLVLTIGILSEKESE